MLIPTFIFVNEKRVRFEEEAAANPPPRQKTAQPIQQRHLSSCLQPQWCDVRRDFKGRKIIVAHKGPCYGNGPSADGGDGKGGTDDVKKGANGNGEAKNGEKKGQNGGDGGGKKSGGGGDEEAQEFTPEEDEKLKALKAEGKSWAQIIPELGGRSKKPLQERWKIVNPKNGGGNVPANNKNGGGGDGQKDGEKGGNGGGAAKNESNKNAADNNGEQQPKLTNAQKKAARKEAKDAGGGEPEKPTADDNKKNNDAKPPPAAAADKKKPASSNNGGGDAHFPLDEWITLQEDELFSFGELRLLSELVAQYDAGRWGMVSSRFFDKTGRRVHPDDVREKFMGVMG